MGFGKQLPLMLILVGFLFAELMNTVIGGDLSVNRPPAGIIDYRGCMFLFEIKYALNDPECARTAFPEHDFHPVNDIRADFAGLGIKKIAIMLLIGQ